MRAVGRSLGIWVGWFWQGRHVVANHLLRPRRDGIVSSHARGELACQINRRTLSVVFIAVSSDVSELLGALFVMDGCADLDCAKIIKDLGPAESDLAVSSDLDKGDAPGASHPANGGDGGLQPGGEF